MDFFHFRSCFKTGDEGKEKKDKKRKRKEKDRKVWKNKSISNHPHPTNASFEADSLALILNNYLWNRPQNDLTLLEIRMKVFYR